MWKDTYNMSECLGRWIEVCVKIHRGVCVLEAFLICLLVRMIRI